MPPKNHLPAKQVEISPENQGTLLQVTESTTYGSIGAAEIAVGPNFPDARAEAPIVPPTPEEPRTVDVNGEMVEALIAIGRAGMQHALPSAPERELRQRYHPLEIEGRKDDAPFNASIYENAAETALRRALGAPRLDPEHQHTLAEEARETAFQREWHTFKRTYAGPENRNARARFRKRLRKTGEPLVARLVAFDPTVSDDAQPPAPTTQATGTQTSNMRRPATDLHAKNSLRRTLQETYFGLNPESYDDISPEALDFAHPARLGKYLMGTGVDRNAPTTLLYYREDRKGHNRENRVAVTASEYKVLRRGLVALAKHGNNVTLAARPDKTDADHEAAKRAMEHVTAEPVKMLHAHLDGKLRPERELIDKFKEATKWKANLARMGDEAGMRQNFASLDTGIIDDMIEAVTEQAGLNYAQAVELKRAVFKRMVIDRADDKHLTYFKNILNIAADYNQHRQNIANSRLEEVGKYLSEYAV